MKLRGFLLTIVTILAIDHHAQAQHLWWDLEGETEATCVYGEINVLATHPHIYYCGVNWHPGEPAGGYCGIQHNSNIERRTIFSIWDTTDALHPHVSAADPTTIYNRFGGEGEGAHTHMPWDWKTGETFRFFVRKQPGKQDGTVEATYFVESPDRSRWINSATITSPTGDKASVATIGGGLNSFLENFAGTDKDAPKIALYRLWIGKSPDQMKCLTKARGDGDWGILDDAYYLAEGDPKKLEAAFSALEKDYGKPTRGEKGKRLAPISDRPVGVNLVEISQQEAKPVSSSKPN